MKSGYTIGDFLDHTYNTVFPSPFRKMLVGLAGSIVEYDGSFEFKSSARCLYNSVDGRRRRWP